MKLTRKQFIGSIISSVAALASFGASSDTHKKGQLHLNGGTHKLKKLVLEDGNFIKGPGTIEIDGPDAILVAGRNVTIDNVVFKTTIGPSKQSSIIKMLEGLHKDETEVVFGMVKRKLPYKGLTARVANKAFPGLIPEEFE